MRSSAGLAWIAFVLTTTVSANVVNQTALANLPQCVKTCSGKVLPMYTCTPEEDCFCEKPQVEISMTACLVESGCSFNDRLAATKFRADTCGQRVHNRGPLLSAVTYTMFGLATVFTMTRALFRSKTLGGAGFGWDDHTAFVAYALLTAMAAGNWYAIHYGEGRYIYTLNADSVSLSLMWFYICNILYSVAIFLTKISLVLLYLRLWPKVPGESSRFKTLCLLSLFGLFAMMIAFTIVCIAQCQPIPYVWTFARGGTGSCIDRTAWMFALGGIEIGWNAIVILLPARRLLTLKVSNPRKLGICLVFLVGIVVIICSFVRLKYISGYTTHKNFTYYYSYIGLWSSVEAYLSQVCCCMPAVAGLLERTSTYVQHLRHHEPRPESPGATVVSGTQFTIFDPPSPSKATDDMEKYSTSHSSSANRSKSEDSAPSPVIALQAGQQSPPTPSPPPKHPSRAFVTTHHDVSGSRDAPDILYHDHFNNVRLSVIDPPESPIRAQLRYIDRNMVPHDIELQGEPRRPSTPRPPTSRPPSRRAMRYSPRPMSPDSVPFAKAKPSWDTLRE